MCSNNQPTPPSVTQTAAAQTGSNVSTALAQQQLNLINQVGPDGSVTYGQTGTYEFTDPSTGKKYTLPKMTQTTSLSAGQQAIYDAMQGAQKNLATTANTQSGRLNDLLGADFSLDNDATEGRLLELGSKRLDPQLAQKREAEIARLSNMGIKIGSTAYDRAMNLVDQGENDARNQLLLSGRQQAVNELLTERATPLNEILALANGQQVQMPNYGATQQTGLAGTDVAGITQQNYANQMAAYQNQQGQNNSLMGGLFSLGSSALMAFSDVRAKENIQPTGEEIAGIPVHTWQWKGTGEPDKGVLAQQVEQEYPELVDNTHPSGLKRVDYGGLFKMGASAQKAA